MASLVRQPSYSRRIFGELNIPEFTEFLRNCIEGGDATHSGLMNGTMNVTDSGIYWNSDRRYSTDHRRSLQHLSIHPNGSHNAVGAVHLRYGIEALNREYVFRIYIIPNNDYIPNDRVLRPIGRLIVVDDSDLQQMVQDINNHHLNADPFITREYWNCVNMIDTIGLCLNTYLTNHNFLQTHYAGYRKKIKGTKRNKTKRNKTKRTKRNKK